MIIPLYDAVQDMVIGYGLGGIGLMIGRTELCQYPTAGNHGVGAQELAAGGGFHLG